MPELGYALSSEEHGPNDLVEYAVRAEAAGFSFALVSDHFHPWIPLQGESPFVWSTLGGVARATDDLRVGTGVTCPIVRIHPAVVAQAAATALYGNTELSARDIVEKGLNIAADICIYTNHSLTIEELDFS